MSTHAIDARLIPLSQIELNPDQPRKYIDPVAQTDLMASIKERGLINAVSVQELGSGRFRLIAGERRYRAVQSLGWEQIDARIWPNTLPQKELELLALVENLQRLDLTPIEEAKEYKKLTEPPFELSQEEIAKQVGKNSRSLITETIALLDLAPEVQGIVERSTISPGQCRYLLKITDKSAQIELAQRAEKEGWSVKETERQVNKLLRKKPKKAKQETRSKDPYNNLWTQLAEANAGLAVKVIYKVPDEWTIHLAPKADESLERWFIQAGESFKGCLGSAAMPAGCPAAPPSEPAPQDAASRFMPSNPEEFAQAEEEQKNIRLPKNSQEQAELDALATQGPAAVYGWIYGKDGFMAKQAAGMTWAELGCTDAAQGCRDLVKTLKEVAELPS